MNKTGGLILYFKIYYKVTIIKTAQYWYKDRQIEQAQEPRNKPHIYGRVIFEKDAETIQWGNDSFFKKQCWGN